MITASFGNGVVGPYTGHSLALRIVIATLAAISCYNAIELVILVFVTFAQFRGPYFWSLLLSALGLIPYSIGFLLKYFGLTDVPALDLALITVGWYLMVTGQSVVLYSRLHLVLPNPRILRRVRTMIIVDACLLHLPTTVLTFGSNLAPHNAVYIAGYNIMEKIQMTGFCLQEFILSALYIWETIRMLRLDPDRGKRKIMYQLVAINLVIIALDLGLLVIEYRDLYILETMIKGVIYSVKLKLEFAVLGKLVLLVRGGLIWKPESAAIYRPQRRPDEFPDFVDATRVTSDLTHAAAGATARRRSHPWMDSEDVSIAMFEHAGESSHDGPRNSRQQTGHSDVSHSWSGETQTNNSAYADVERELSPLDFTDSLGKHKPGEP
ncbi:integral membrane protein [Aspergillus ellipticus CBS 707.79]|uniref:Integral membrane protein n=1 Tax=Aspergillus ellipticus CBS 707.79 TaxID=1448320 RepID=A0A319D298_9EURO|nr:integral membrane protein [Aspergillus ellipticus CBS 707.79]